MSYHVSKAGFSIKGTMKKLNTAHWKAGLLRLLLAVGTVTGMVLAQDGTEPPPGFIGKKRARRLAGHGTIAGRFTYPHPVPARVTAGTAAAFADLGQRGCSDNGRLHDKFLREIASYGYIVVAQGYAWQRPRRNDPAGKKKTPQMSPR